MDGIYNAKFDEQAPSWTSRYGSSPERERGAAVNRRVRGRRVDRLGRARVGPGPLADRVRRGAGLELVSVTGGLRHEYGSAKLDAAVGTELIRRSR